MDNSLRPAKITDRFLAYLVDIAPFLAGYFASLYFLIVRLAIYPNLVAVWVRFFVAWLLAYLAYQALGNLSGATLGKRLLGLRVVRPDGSRLGLARSLLRAIGYLVSSPLLNLGFLWSLFDRDSRTWHDLLAGSVVIEVRAKSPTAALGSAALSFSVLIAMLGGNLWFAFGKPSPQDEEAIRKAREGLEILAAIEEAHKAERGTYTQSIVELAQTSGDVGQFKEAMQYLFDPDGFVFIADKESYMLKGRALDRRRTEVVRKGPRARVDSSP